MRPAFSVIFFSVLSGAGYGLLACAAIAALIGPQCITPDCAQTVPPLNVHAPFLTAVVLIALTLVIAGLGASVTHLGRPERAWRAFSQWRTSWLSREGVSASASLLAASAMVALLWFGQLGLATRLAAAASILLGLATVFCTARIYTSLPPIPAWGGPLVLPVYLLFAATTGIALWVALSRVLLGSAPMFGQLALAVFALATAVLKWRYWQAIDAIGMPSTAHMTGLDRMGAGAARSFEAPHTEANYLTKEMGFRFARRHARVLRATVLASLIATGAIAALSFVVPALAATAPPSVSPVANGAAMRATIGTLLLLIAALLTLLAALAERWLFFAQARHMVMAYYAR
ncbi:MAG: DmsC/YnfH family molybdoenzyme membrane anchor subunit [Lysobacterales bacterium]